MNLMLKRSAMALMCLLCACQAEDQMAPAESNTLNKNGRLVFADATAGMAVLDELTNADDDFLDHWEQKQKFVSVRTLSNQKLIELDSVSRLYPSHLKAILNSEFEYQYGDTVVWFHGNYLFKVLENEDNLLSQIKDDPHSDRFVKYRAMAIQSFVGKAKNGREIPSSVVYSTTFRLTAAHDYRFGRHLYNIFSGIYGSNSIVLSSYLQYRANNGNWYQAGEIVERQTIYAWFVTDPGYSAVYIGGAYKSIDNTNQEFTYTISKNGSPGFFKGSVTATFHQKVTSAYAGTIDFISESVSWY